MTKQLEAIQQAQDLGYLKGVQILRVPRPRKDRLVLIQQSQDRRDQRIILVM